LSNPFKVGQHVRYMPPHRTDGELYEYAEVSGLKPRKLYVVESVDGERLTLCGGKSEHFSSFKNGDLDYRLGKDDDTWDTQKKRLDDRHDNFYKST